MSTPSFEMGFFPDHILIHHHGKGLPILLIDGVLRISSKWMHLPPGKLHIVIIDNETMRIERVPKRGVQ